MPAIVEKTATAASPKVLVFRSHMATAPQIPPEQPAGTGGGGYSPQRHGNWAQWVSPLAAIVACFLTVGTVVHYRNADASAKTSDEHVNALIDTKLNPISKDFREELSKQLAPINAKLDDLTTRVGKLEGRFQQLDAGQKNLNARIDQHEAIARIQEDPTDILDTIRGEVRLAAQKKEPLPYSKLVDFKLALHAFPPSTEEYWRTIAELINYQSLLEQTRGHAPDPAKVSRPCFGMTNGDGMLSQSNTQLGGAVANCIVDLDTQQFIGVTFVNSVIRYNGGPTDLRNVTFVNCRFILQIESQKETRPERQLLFALLDTPSQTHVRVTTR